jgi:hypothetical protein
MFGRLAGCAASHAGCLFLDYAAFLYHPSFIEIVIVHNRYIFAAILLINSLYFGDNPRT